VRAVAPIQCKLVKLDWLNIYSKSITVIVSCIYQRTQAQEGNFSKNKIKTGGIY